MTLHRRLFLAAGLAGVLVAGLGTAALAQDGVKKLALQVSDGDPQTLARVLNVAANFSKSMIAAGDDYEIEIVAFSQGLNLFREDKSPVLDRVRNFPQSVPNVTLSACNNTIAAMTKKEGKAPPIIPEARVVPAGVVRLLELDAEGYVVIRP